MESKHVSGEVDHDRIEHAVREILSAVGEDPDREGLIDTPSRVVRAYEEFFAGLDQDPAEVLHFTCLSGDLQVARRGERLELDFPVRRAEPVMPVLRDEAERALGFEVEQVLALFNADGSVQELMVVLASEADVRALQPDLRALATLPGLGVLVTAGGQQHDFVSRYFAPSIGIDEDPVTGSTHCILMPYWVERLGRTTLNAFQCSARGGELLCRLDGERVKIAGHARHIASGQLLL